MEFKEYQKRASETAAYPNIGKNITYPTLGLTGEAGEIANSIKKITRDDDGVITDERRELLKKELGDILWYIAQLGTELNLDLEMIAQNNLEKLASRKKRGVITGAGDNR